MCARNEILMPNKTDRILSYLPRTFLALPKPTALFATVDAFGGELLRAENSLAALMIAHWVDHADRGADLIQDLACIASLYGLGPRGADPTKQIRTDSRICRPVPADETVEEFREHLKHYVRTFLEGTVTVQGVLRVTAEALGLLIEDDYDQLDAWWKRDDDSLATIAPRGDDAAELLLGLAAANVAGADARAARIIDSVDLPDPVDLGAGAKLRLAIDSAAAVEIALPENAPLAQIADTVNQALKAKNPAHDRVASLDGHRLALASPTIGADSTIEIADVEGDAAPRLLGLSPRVYRGSAATRAQAGSVELGGVIDLSQARFLRLNIDGKHLAEVDCAGADAARTTPAEIAGKINGALKATVGADLATINGQRLMLTSPTAGFGSSIALLPAAAQDARELLFGSASTFYSGSDPQRARVAGTIDLNGGVDLSRRSQLRVRLDSQATITVDVAGANPSVTLPSEIVAALNARLGAGLASHDGHFLAIVSSTAGPAGLVSLESPPPQDAERDATELLFGIGSRLFKGADATAAQIRGASDLRPFVNVAAVSKLRIGIDGNGPQEIDIAAFAADRTHANLREIRKAINKATGVNLAADDGAHLILSSPTVGAASRLTIEPLETVIRQRFVTRAFFRDEAATRLFGFRGKQSQGAVSTYASIASTEDISRGVDLSQSRLLRLNIGGQAAEIDCAGPRPRATLPSDVVKNIEAKLGTHLHVEVRDGKRLILTALAAGAGHQIAFEPPRGTLQTLFGSGPQTVRGIAARGVRFVGTVDLSGGVELAGDGAIKISVDGEPAVQIACAHPPAPVTPTPAPPDDSHEHGGAETSDESRHDMHKAPVASEHAPVSVVAAAPPHTHKVTLRQIVTAINAKLGTVASDDGKYLILTSPAGPKSGIRFEAPSNFDSTEALLGIKAGELPREYKGQPATTARIESPVLPNAPDLSAARTLRLSINGGAPIDVDCANVPAGQNVTHETIAGNINDALKAAGAPATATLNGTQLILETMATGNDARIALLMFPGDDAREKLFGAQPLVTPGSDPAAAIIEGEADLRVPANLAERRTIRLAVDGGRPVEVDVSGSAPEVTTLDEIVARINAVFPGLASATPQDRLRLTSPTLGAESSLEVAPVRWLELIEYPPSSVSFPENDAPPLPVQHGGHWTLDNNGAAETPLQIELLAPHGVSEPSFINRTTGARIAVNAIVPAGARLRLWAEGDGSLSATLTTAEGATRRLKPTQIVAQDPTVLILPQGVSEWSYLDCGGARFDYTNFATPPPKDGDDDDDNYMRFTARFAGGGYCAERAVFDISHFSNAKPRGKHRAFFALAMEPPVELCFRWMSHQAGAFRVNLPADLPEQFGGRFNLARFGNTVDAAEKYSDVVTEPISDTRHNLVVRINNESKLVVAQIVPRAELGFSVVKLPIRHPKERHLQGGSATEPARLYVQEEGGPIIKLIARKPDTKIDEKDPKSFDNAQAPGAQGNAIVVTAQKAGLARFDISIGFRGARFESARQIARGNDATQLEELLKPGPVGILQAKAAGIQAEVTRDGASLG